MIDRDQCWRFAQALARLEAPEDSNRRSDLGTLAHLRRGLGKGFGEASARDGWVLHTLEKIREAGPPSEDWTERDIEWACCVASLFAMHRGSSADHFAVAYRKLWQRRGETQSVVRRFTSLIDADESDLGTHLRHAASLLKAEDIALDWGGLLFDVVRWNDPGRRVQRKWNRDFWLESASKRTARSKNLNK